MNVARDEHEMRHMSATRDCSIFVNGHNFLSDLSTNLFAPAVVEDRQTNPERSYPDRKETNRMHNSRAWEARICVVAQMLPSFV